MFRRLVSLVLASVFACALVACGGGGGSSGSGGGGGFVPTPTPSPTPAFTNASGTVVDDSSGSPLSGVKVALEPWAACATPTPTGAMCPTPLPSPQATTDANGNFTLDGAANGHYLLIVGNDTPGDSARTTVHDNVTLTGGNQALHAPTLPPIPTITAPVWETNGAYRLSALDVTSEVPCMTAFDTQRVNRHLAEVVADEWLYENTRAGMTYRQNPAFSPAPWPGNVYGGITTGNELVLGGTDCPSSLIAPSFITDFTYAIDPRTRWFAGRYNAYNPNVTASAVGIAAFPIDPASFTDPNVPVWP